MSDRTIRIGRIAITARCIDFLAHHRALGGRAALQTSQRRTRRRCCRRRRSTWLI
jgi:hypothetical protein